MANEQHLALLREGIQKWNSWRKSNPRVIPDLSKSDLSGGVLAGMNLTRANLRQANLSSVNLDHSRLEEADLRGSNLTEAILGDTRLRSANLESAIFEGAWLGRADFTHADMTQTNLRSTRSWTDFLPSSEGAISGGAASFNHAKLRHADFRGATLESATFVNANLDYANLRDASITNADFTGADLTEAVLSDGSFTGSKFRNANLSAAKLIRANLTATDLNKADLRQVDATSAFLESSSMVDTVLDDAVLTGCRVYGISVWNIRGMPKNQDALIVTPQRDPTVTVDNLEIAQFIYLLLNRKNLRMVLTTITSKAVLLLGRFTPERKTILDAMADELRKHDFLPIIFDFERVKNLDFTETIKVLAGLSLFVIVDLTKPKSVPQELQATVPDYQKPFVLILEKGKEPYSMLRDFSKYDWVLKPLLKYPSKDSLLAGFKKKIIDRAWEKHKEIQQQKNDELATESIEDFMEETENLSMKNDT